MSKSYGVRTASTNASQKYLIRKSQGRCAICGKSVNVRGVRHKEWNVDHIFPKAIVKWALGLDKTQKIEARRLLSSLDNMVITHPWCNKGKGCLCYTNKDIKALHLTDEAKQNIFVLKTKLKFAIDSYESIRKKLLYSCEFHCQNCGRDLNPVAVIRRRNNKLPRSIKNSLMLCEKCNYKYDRVRRTNAKSQ